MIIRISLLLALSSIIALLSADFAARLSLTNSSIIITQIGVALLFIEFIFLILKGLLAFTKSIVLSVGDYFSVQNRKHRQLLHIHAKRDRFERLFYFKKLQIHYFTQHKINNLLVSNHHKQLKSLSKAIRQELQLKQKEIPVTIFRQLQNEKKTYLNRQDIEALLKLQQRISTLNAGYD